MGLGDGDGVGLGDGDGVGLGDGDGVGLGDGDVVGLDDAVGLSVGAEVLTQVQEHELSHIFPGQPLSLQHRQLTFASPFETYPVGQEALPRAARAGIARSCNSFVSRAMSATRTQIADEPVMCTRDGSAWSLAGDDDDPFGRASIPAINCKVHRFPWYQPIAWPSRIEAQAHGFEGATCRR